MRRIILVLTAALIMAGMLAITGGTASAQGCPKDTGIIFFRDVGGEPAPQANNPCARDARGFILI